MTDPQMPARLATEIGRPHGLACRYEYDRVRGVFCYRFTRHGRFIGSTTDAKKVVAKMERYAETK